MRGFQRDDCRSSARPVSNRSDAAMSGSADDDRILPSMKIAQSNAQNGFVFNCQHQAVLLIDSYCRTILPIY
jgi:hypothetical protein